ncbi:cadmium resistance transporter [Ornithinibacillus sp. FSL M8-0202]|uniref:cadmium resistance transporter n=1 Tax=unclassified Ornithinibacillus TaxID=2620869 RepID=UPI0030D2A6B0
MATILTMAIMFIAAGIDEMIVLIFLFAHAKSKRQERQIYIGQQLGMTGILIISLIALYGISFITGKWTGLFGLLPIAIGIMALFEGDDEEEERERILHKTSIFSNLTLRVFVIALAGGAEEVAIMVPYFTTLTSYQIILASITFFVMVLIWSGLCHLLASSSKVYTFVNKYKRIIIPLVFIGIGLHILLENDTIETILDLFL